MQEIYTVGITAFTDINLALIEEAKTGNKIVTMQLNDWTAEIDNKLGVEMYINDDKGEVLHAFEIKTNNDDISQGDEFIGQSVEVDSIEIYGKNIDKIKFTEEFKRDIENSAEDVREEMNQNI